MPIDFEKFKPAYEKWVEESLPDYQAGNMKKIIKKYPFIVSDGVPWTPYKGQPSEQTFALVTSGGFYLKEHQPPFDTVSIHGDTSFREIPKTVHQEDLAIAHAHYDHSLAEQDINGLIKIVSIRSFSFSRVRVAMIAGALQPKPINIGMKDFP